jgi:hypothetical protein
VRASTGTVVAEAEHIQRSIVLGHRRQTRHIPWSLLAVEGVEEPAVDHRLKPALQTLEVECVSRSELHLDPTLVGLRSGDRERRLSDVDAQNRQSHRGKVKSVVAGPAARIEHRSG